MMGFRVSHILIAVIVLAALAVSHAALFSRPRHDWGRLGFRGTSMPAAAALYNASLTRLNRNRPVIDSQVPKSSVFTYNYNAAVVPNAVRDALAFFVLFSLSTAPSRCISAVNPLK